MKALANLWLVLCIHVQMFFLRQELFKALMDRRRAFNELEAAIDYRIAAQRNYAAVSDAISIAEREITNKLDELGKELACLTGKLN